MRALGYAAVAAVATPFAGFLWGTFQFFSSLAQYGWTAILCDLAR